MGGGYALRLCGVVVRTGVQVSTTELVAIIIAGVGSIFTGIGVVVRALRTATTDSTEILRAHVARLEARVRMLDAWKYTAILYIWQLRGHTARHGIHTPDPPPELDLIEKEEAT